MHTRNPSGEEISDKPKTHNTEVKIVPSKISKLFLIPYCTSKEVPDPVPGTQSWFKRYQEDTQATQASP